MKIKINYKLFVAAGILLLGLAGCLKEKYENGAIQPTHSINGTPKVVEIGLTATSTENFLLVAVDNSTSDTTVNFIPVTLATSEAAAEDIHVTLALDATQIDNYNTANGTAYELAPQDKYTIINTVVTIPKGSNTGYLQLKFKPSDFIGHDYAFAFVISSIQEAGYTISGNFDKGVAAITIKNQFDGVYEAIGEFTHPSLGGSYDSEWEAATSGPTSITFQLNTTVLFGVFITFTVDPVTNAVAVTREGGVLDPYDPSENYYDPATRTFHYDFGYSGSRRAVGTATYLRPR